MTTRSSEEIEAIIQKAELATVCDPRQGDCVSVAVALNAVFDGDEYVCGYEMAGDTRPRHASVRIDGVLFDGTGRIPSEDVLYDYAVGGLRASEIGRRDEHVGTVSKLEGTRGYNHTTRMTVQERLETILAD